LGTGGVALFGLQLAKTAGAKAIMLSSSDEKLQKAKQMGADELINYRLNPDWEKQVIEKTGQIGADLILELGGIGTLTKSMASTKINGRISMVGVFTGTEGQVDPMPILRKTLSVNGIYAGSGDMQVQLHNTLETNKIHPVIDRIFPFDKVRDAYEYMQSGKHFGKIVIQLD
jgi:NADPH:quinone reductase-like Zn-dependent oxidoreductase